MFNKIMVPLDSSGLATGILPHVAYLASRLNIPVELVTVLVHDQLEALEKGSKGDEDDCSEGLLEMNAAEDSLKLVAYQGIARENGDDYSPVVLKNAVLPAARYLGEMARQLSEQGVQARAVVCAGVGPAEAALRVADQDKCDLIAIATHDRNLLMQAIQGSVTNEVVRAGQAPVLAISPEKSETASGGYSPALTNILVPLDGSTLAEAVLPYVESLARGLSLSVVLVTVIRDQYVSAAISDNHSIYPEVLEAQREARRADQQDAQQYLERVADGLARKGINVQWEVLQGATEPSLERLSEQLSNNLIALASHGRSGLARWVLGSVAEDLIRKTGDPVLVIPSGVAGE